jgi:hypothetical protein
MTQLSYYSTRSAIANIASPSNLDTVVLSEKGREGTFAYSTSNLSNEVSADTQQAVYVAPSSDTDGSSGAWVRRCDGPLSLKWFGAVGDGSTDDSAAFVALNAFCHLNNGTGYGGGRACFVPRGTYYVASMVTFDTPVHLFGEVGGGTFEYNRTSRILTPSGETAFRFVTGSAVYSTNALITDLSFQALGKNSNSTTGSMTYNSRTLTLASASDFANGDVVIVRGAGYSGRFRGGLTASVTSGSPVITLSVAGPTGAYPGMVLSVTGAGFPASAKVVSVNNSTGAITMSANATATVSGKQITVYGDLVGYVASGGGTTTLAMSAYAHADVSNVDVIHADCGIYALTTVNLERVEITGYPIGVAMTAGGMYTQPSGNVTNANCANWMRIIVHSNRIGAFIAGSDANACNFINMVGFSQTEYSFVDQCFLGNSWFNSHTSGGLGILHPLFVSCSLFDYCYTEGGTVNSFGSNATGSGIQSSANDGGLRLIPSQGYLGMPPMMLYPHADSECQVYLGEPVKDHGIIHIDNSGRGGSGNIALFHYSGGLWFTSDYTNFKIIEAFSDGGFAATTSHAGGAGHKFFPRGINIGDDTTAISYTASKYRRHVYGSAAPASGPWNQGDILWNNAPTAGGTLGWVCVSSGSPGTWKAIAGIAP